MKFHCSMSVECVRKQNTSGVCSRSDRNRVCEEQSRECRGETRSSGKAASEARKSAAQSTCRLPGKRAPKTPITEKRQKFQHDGTQPDCRRDDAVTGKIGQIKLGLCRFYSSILRNYLCVAFVNNLQKNQRMI